MKVQESTWSGWFITTCRAVLKNVHLGRSSQYCSIYCFSRCDYSHTWTFFIHTEKSQGAILLLFLIKETRLKKRNPLAKHYLTILPLWCGPVSVHGGLVPVSYSLVCEPFGQRSSVPISLACNDSPFLYWKMKITNRTRKKEHGPFRMCVLL